jgi:HEPN domain-containing protein/predicted nucleotidyltransferase
VLQTPIKRTVQEQIDRMVPRIAKKFHPEQIILLGSQARGDAGPDSDIDLLVVMDFEGSKFDKRMEVARVVRGEALPVDIIITTPADFAWRKEVTGTIEWPAFREGKVFYDAGISSARSNGRQRGKERSQIPAPDEARLQVLREWLDKAENGLTAAAYILKLGKAAPADSICFHAQLCIEQYLKAVLVHRGRPVPKTHDIQDVMQSVPRARRPSLTTDEQRQLTDYATVIDYPKAGLAISLPEARRAVAMARRVRREVRRLLPRAALRREKK